MLEEIFGQAEYYHFPSFEVALYSLVLSFVLSAVLALTYRFTYTRNTFPLNFFQAIVLSSMVSSMVIMAVGNNVAAGFGIIGALAIIRFRTTIQDPRNIIFIFASLSIGIATGVYGYAIAISGTMLFTAVVIMLHYSPYGTRGKSYLELQLTIESEAVMANIETLLQRESVRFSIVQYRKQSETETIRYTLKIEMQDNKSVRTLFEKLNEIQGLAEIRIQEAAEVAL